MSTIKPPTLTDVARVAGVSVCTASKAMREADGVAAKTVQRIRAAARSLGYVPNNAARALAGQGTLTIGFLVSNTQNRYYGTLLGAVNAIAAPNGYTIISGDSVDAHGVPQADLAEGFTRSLAEHRVSGVLVMGPVSTSSIERFMRAGIPVVSVDCWPNPDLTYLPGVMTDNEKGGFLAGEHLVKHGYREFCFIGHPAVWTTREGRQQGFLAATRGHGHTSVVDGGYNVDETRRAVEAYLDAAVTLPDGFFATNDAMARAAMDAFMARGLVIGRDIGGISFDEFDWAAHVDPPLTTIDQHVEQLGQEAATLLLDLIDNPGQASRAEVRKIAPTLVVRASCGCQNP